MQRKVHGADRPAAREVVAYQEAEEAGRDLAVGAAVLAVEGVGQDLVVGAAREAAELAEICGMPEPERVRAEGHRRRTDLARESRRVRLALDLAPRAPVQNQIHFQH